MPESSSSQKTSSRGKSQQHKSRKQSTSDSSCFNNNNVIKSPSPIKQEKGHGIREPANESEQRQDRSSYSPPSSPPLASSSPGGVKAPQCPTSIISPSSSPRSPTQISSHRTLSTSLPTSTPPQPPFTPPKSLNAACFNPVMGGLSAAIGGLGPIGLFNGGPQGPVPEGMRNLTAATMPRNCSDLIRSMAAKYNNPNGSNANIRWVK